MKMLLLSVLFPLLQDARQTFTVQNKPAAVAPKETITHHFFVSGIGQKKSLMQPNVRRAENVVKKTETLQNIRKMDCSVLLLRHLYSAGSACIAQLQ